MLDGRTRGDEANVHVTALQGCNSRSIAVKWHFDGLELGQRANHGVHGEGHGALASEVLLDLVGVGLHKAQQILRGVPGGVGAGHQQDGVGHGGDVDRVELVVVEVRCAHDTVQRLRLGAHKNGVAVSGLLQHEVGTDDASSTRFVLQDDFLAQRFLSVGGVATHGHVSAATGAPLDDSGHIAGGVALCHGLATHRRSRYGCQCGTQELAFHFLHACLHFSLTKVLNARTCRHGPFHELCGCNCRRVNTLEHSYKTSKDRSTNLFDRLSIKIRENQRFFER